MKISLLLAGIPVIFALASCCHTPKGRPHPSEGVQAYPGGKRTTVWINDGSAATFNDTIQLVPVQTSHPLAGTGCKEFFEGLPDYGVGIGSLGVPCDSMGYDGEAEWVLEFRRPLASFREEDIDGTTPCTLKGMIEGKKMSLMTSLPRTSWGPFSIGNNVITPAGIGHDCTLGNLPRGAQMTIDFGRRKGVHVSKTEDLTAHFGEGHNGALVELIKAVAKECRNRPELHQLRLVNLSALGGKAAFVNDEGRQKSCKWGSVLGSAFTLFLVEPTDFGRKCMVSKVPLDERAHAPEVIRLTLTHNGKTVSECRLHLEPEKK